MAVPRSIAGSLHKKKDFDVFKPKAPGDSMMYSKSDLLKMILENDHATSELQKTGPIISAAEAIHGSLNFVVKK